MADLFPVPQLTPIDAYADKSRKTNKKVGFNANATCSIDVQEGQNAQRCQENAFVIRGLEDAKIWVGLSTRVMSNSDRSCG
jgi:hypothetical protein